MVVNLRMQLESYSNDQLMHALCNEQESPEEIVQMARSIVLARGLSQRNILERATTLRKAKSEAAAFLNSGKPFEEIVAYIRDKYILEEPVAEQLVHESVDFDNTPIMVKCLGYFVSGILLFYVLRVVINML